MSSCFPAFNVTKTCYCQDLKIILLGLDLGVTGWAWSAGYSQHTVRRALDLASKNLNAIPTLPYFRLAVRFQTSLHYLICEKGLPGWLQGLNKI